MKNMMIKTLLGASFALLLPNISFAKDGDIEVTGFISKLSQFSVTLHNNIQYILNNATEYEDMVGNYITLAEFQVGDLVELKYNIIDGQFVVREMELEDEYQQ